MDILSPGDEPGITRLVRRSDDSLTRRIGKDAFFPSLYWSRRFQCLPKLRYRFEYLHEKALSQEHRMLNDLTGCNGVSSVWSESSTILQDHWSILRNSILARPLIFISVFTSLPLNIMVLPAMVSAKSFISSSS